MKYYNYTNKLLKLSKQFKKTASELYKYADLTNEEYGAMSDSNNVLRMQNFGTSLQGAVDTYKRVADMRAQADYKKFFEGLDWIDKLKVIFSKIFGTKSDILEKYNQSYAKQVKQNLNQFGRDAAMAYAKQNNSNDLNLLRKHGMSTAGAENNVKAIKFMNDYANTYYGNYMNSVQKQQEGPYKSPTMNQRFTNWLWGVSDVNKEVSNNFREGFDKAVATPQKQYTPQEMQATYDKIVANSPWYYQWGDNVGLGPDNPLTNERMNDINRLNKGLDLFSVKKSIIGNEQLNQANTTNNPTPTPNNPTPNPNVDIVQG